MRLDWAATRPLWLEFWPEAVASLSMPSIQVPLGIADSIALGSQILGFGHWFSTAGPFPLDNIEERLEAVPTIDAGFVVRLGSRAPKDTDLWKATAGRIFTTSQIMRMLTGGSVRLAWDLKRSLSAGFETCLHLRVWRNIPPWSELRLFFKNRHLIAASQYDSNDRTAGDQLWNCHSTVIPALGVFEERFGSVSPLADVVADVWFDTESQEVELIDLNPFHPFTDASFYSWVALDWDGALRLFRDGQILAIPLCQ